MKLSSAWLWVCVLSPSALAQEQTDRFARTHSRGDYVHRIELLDANKERIDPRSESPRPYAPSVTCGKCHDVATIHRGYHFSAPWQDGGSERPGEPWIYWDPKSGTQLPLSYRSWPGTWKPRSIGLTPREFVRRFARQWPGVRFPDDVESDPRDGLSGLMDVDCMICHQGDRSYDATVWASQMESENFDWAATAALGLGKVEGKVSTLKEGASVDKLPKVTYDLSRFDLDDKVYFDIVRKPHDGSCLHCHTVRDVSGVRHGPHDGDVHSRAGISCTDCHHHGLDHQVTRGYRDEPVSESTSSSCYGCHMGEKGGRFGAPKPEHAGLPPIHLDTMSCTSCHSGVWPFEGVGRVQTSMAHGLGLPSQTRGDDDFPYLQDGVMARGGDGRIYPHRAMWPAFWGLDNGDTLTPIPPEDIQKDLRRALRVRKDFRSELGVTLTEDAIVAAVGSSDPDDWSDVDVMTLGNLQESESVLPFRDKIKGALASLTEKTWEGTPVYVSSGKVYRLNDDGGLAVSPDSRAAPYLWPIGHDVRPARHSLGIHGCRECHAPDSSFFYADFDATGPAWDAERASIQMHEQQDLDPNLLSGWEKLMEGRDTFKWVGFVSMGLLAFILCVAMGLALVGGWRLRPGRNSNRPVADDSGGPS